MKVKESGRIKEDKISKNKRRKKKKEKKNGKK
jgi:hypothetical protein